MLLVKVNTDEQPAIAAQLRIQSLPTVYAFRDGRPLDGFMGAQPESQIRAFIDRLVGGGEGESDITAILEIAQTALEQGDCRAPRKPMPPCFRRISRMSMRSLAWRDAA